MNEDKIAISMDIIHLSMTAQLIGKVSRDSMLNDSSLYLVCDHDHGHQYTSCCDIGHKSDEM